MAKKSTKIGCDIRAVKRLGGDVEAVYYYEYIYFWYKQSLKEGRGKSKGWTYQSKKGIQDAIGLTRDKQDRIRKKLIAEQWIEVKKMKANGKPTLHFRCNVDLDEVIHSRGFVAFPISGKPTNQKSGKPTNE